MLTFQPGPTNALARGAFPSRQVLIPNHAIYGQRPINSYYNNAYDSIVRAIPVSQKLLGLCRIPLAQPERPP